MRTMLGGISAALLATTAAAQTFDGYDCLDDCSGHRAGFEWARDNNVTSETECDTSSWSFVEGCRVYLQNPYHDPEVDDDGNEIPD